MGLLFFTILGIIDLYEHSNINYLAYVIVLFVFIFSLYLMYIKWLFSIQRQKSTEHIVLIPLSIIFSILEIYKFIQSENKEFPPPLLFIIAIILLVSCLTNLILLYKSKLNINNNKK